MFQKSGLTSPGLSCEENIFPGMLHEPAGQFKISIRRIGLHTAVKLGILKGMPAYSRKRKHTFLVFQASVLLRWDRQEISNTVISVILFLAPSLSIYCR